MILAYIIPPMINFYGKSFSIGELIVKGYATVFRNGLPIPSYFDITSFINPGSCLFFLSISYLSGELHVLYFCYLDYRPNVPRYNKVLRRFDGGVRTDYRSNFKENCRGNYRNNEEYNRDNVYAKGIYEKGIYEKKVDYHQSAYKPKCKLHIWGS